MTGIIYDLLVGHEVGHALYTPAEGWHDAVMDNDKNKNYKNFLNVIEDARIEKKVKRKYPGLNSSFRQAYQELNIRDFFGIKGREVNEMPFIDRLNLFSKSQWSSTWIQFSAKEELLVKEVQAAETWDDVVRITNKVYEYSKEEQHEMALQYYDDMMANMADESDDDGYDMSDYDSDYGDDGEDDEDGKGEGNSPSDEFEEEW
jgi:cobalamin biosynthesis protein CobT